MKLTYCPGVVRRLSFFMALILALVPPLAGITGLPATALAADPAYPDIAGHPAQQAIEYLAGQNIVQGQADGLFHPEEQVTRAELITMLVRALHLRSAEHPLFTDTVQHWAREYIGIAFACGLASGYGDGSFGPDDPVTREQLAVMVVNAAGIESSGSLDGISDRDQISSWARRAVATACSRQIMALLPDSRFAPGTYATRGECALAVYAIISPESVNEGENENPSGPQNQTGPPPVNNNTSNGLNNSAINNLLPVPAPDQLYDINIADVQGGTASVTADKTAAAAGDLVTVTISGVESGKAVQAISATDADGNNVSLSEKMPGAAYEFSMPAAAVTVSVVLAVSTVVNPPLPPGLVLYNIDIANTLGGSATVAASASQAAAGEKVNVFVSGIENGKALDIINIADSSGQSISCNTETAGSVYSFTMPASDVAIQASLKEQSQGLVVIDGSNNQPVVYSVSIDPVENGSAQVSTDIASGTFGQTVTVTIASIQGSKEFESISVVDSKGQALSLRQNSAGISYSFELPQDNVTIKVRLRDQIIMPIVVIPDPIVVNVMGPYDVNIAPVINGTATVTSSHSSASANEMVTIMVSGVNPGLIKSITVRDANNALLPPAIHLIDPPPNSYTFMMPFSAVTVQVELQPIQVILVNPKFAINIQSISGSPVRVTADSPTCEADTTAYLNVSMLPKSKDIDSIKVTTTSGQVVPVTTVTTNSRYKFTMPRADVNVTVTLKEHPLKVTISWYQTNPGFPFAANEMPRAWTLVTTAKPGEAVRFYVSCPQFTGVHPVLNNGAVDYGYVVATSTFKHMYTWMPDDDLDIVIGLSHKVPRSSN